jgi:hypothetical protein
MCTLRVEVHIPGDGTVLPGAFVYVRLAVERNSAPLLIPASALIVRKDGTQVAGIADGSVTLQTVVIGRDLGKELEILAGVSVGDHLVLNPADDLSDGVRVQEVADPPAPARSQ